MKDESRGIGNVYIINSTKWHTIQQSSGWKHDMEYKCL